MYAAVHARPIIPANIRDSPLYLLDLAKARLLASPIQLSTISWYDAMFVGVSYFHIIDYSM